jgi:TRAP-type mannitol/chloroaromatic compound transport system permease small subunit
MLALINKINEGIGRAVSWLTTILVLLVCFDVFRRYALRDSAAWIMELEWHIFSVIFLIGDAYTLKHNKHVRVDLFYEKFESKDRAWVNLIGTLFFLMPWCVVLGYVSFHYAMNSLNILEGSPDPGGLPARYIIKFCIPLAMLLLFLQALAVLIKSWHAIRNKDEI